MKDFMLIFKGPDYGKLGLSPDEIQAQMGKWFAWIEQLQQQERFKSGEALLPPSKTVTGVGTVTDGPYAESKEMVGGYFIVKAADMADAVALADGFPDFHLDGSVEVREVAVFDN